MIQMTRAACVLLLIAATFAQPLCPRSKEVGNFINYLHLFKEEADTLLSFYNAKTNVEVLFNTPATLAGATDHKVLFKVTDTNVPKKVWIYAVWAKLNSSQVILDIVNFMKFRYINDADVNSIASELFKIPVVVGAPLTTKCFTSVIKLEYDYFYYMFANYYKNGLGEKDPRTL